MSQNRARRGNHAAAIVRATCATCGDVEMGIADVQVQTCMTTGGSTYSFRCPVCAVIVDKHATDPVVEALASAGARMIAWTLPAELDEPKTGPRISHDDLLEFHLDLEADAWQNELASMAWNGWS